ncbi:TetR/AcrR family transcriptional regulator [Rhodococcus erythropolis]|uniref:TetR/AcrR family transcriptional regulator n=1 Tax=Rhodococcus erythropolis TaxID=1833 RepID=UPI00210B7703|nr:TetR/AcrR family transcriptional regulator [Rhodococcus erythropolis]MCQ4127668.1 TetR/AcrR family transcriptional regulator [Rhodococcus erythropolis]
MGSSIDKPRDERANRDRPQQSRAIATRKAILAASAASFDANGYAAVSIMSIIGTSDITKGAVYFHFRSKEAIALQLVEDWSDAVRQAFSPVDAAIEGSALTQLHDSFIRLANRVDTDTAVRAGMKLSREPSLSAVDKSYRQWMEIVQKRVDEALEAGAMSETPMIRRSAWNLCAGFVGAVNGMAVTDEDTRLAVHVEDILSAYLGDLRGAHTEHGISLEIALLA